MPTRTRHTADEKVWSNRQVPQGALRLRAHGPLGVCAQAARTMPLATHHAPARATTSPLGWRTSPTRGEPINQLFRLLDKRQSGSAHVLADASPGCEHELCRFASDAVVMARASGSDELQRPGPVPVGLVLPSDAEAVDGVPGAWREARFEGFRAPGPCLRLAAPVCSRSFQPSRSRRRSSGRCFQSKRQHIPANGDAVR